MGVGTRTRRTDTPSLLPIVGDDWWKGGSHSHQKRPGQERVQHRARTGLVHHEPERARGFRHTDRPPVRNYGDPPPRQDHQPKNELIDPPVGRRSKAATCRHAFRNHANAACFRELSERRSLTLVRYESEKRCSMFASLAFALVMVSRSVSKQVASFSFKKAESLPSPPWPLFPPASPNLQVEQRYFSPRRGIKSPHR